MNRRAFFATAIIAALSAIGFRKLKFSERYAGRIRNSYLTIKQSGPVTITAGDTREMIYHPNCRCVTWLNPGESIKLPRDGSFTVYRTA